MRYILIVVLILATGAVAFGEEDSGTPSGVSAQLEIAAQNLQTLASQPATSERTMLVEKEVNVTNEYLTRYHVVKQTLSKSQLVQMLKDLGYLRSGASTWGQNEVSFCLQEKILVGRTDGTTPASAEWKTSMTREEGAAMAARISKQADRKIGEHNSNVGAHASAFASHNEDFGAHQGVIGAQHADRTWLWVLSAVLLLALLALAIRRWRTRAPVPGPTVFTTPGVITPVVAGGNTGLYNIVLGTPARNGSGVQLYS